VTNSDNPGRVVIRQPAADTLTDILTFRDDQQKLKAAFDAKTRFRLYKAAGDSQPYFQFGDDIFGNSSINLGGGGSTQPDIRLRWNSNGTLTVDRNSLPPICNAGARANLVCNSDTTVDCPGTCSGGGNPGTQCQVADCGSGGSCVAGGCSGGPTPGKSCCYGGGVCSNLPVCPGCCGAPPTTLDVGAFNAGFNSTLRMWGPNIGTGSTFGTITFDGNQFIFNPPLPGIGSGCSVTGGVITCNGIKLH